MKYIILVLLMFVGPASAQLALSGAGKTGGCTPVTIPGGNLVADPNFASAAINGVTLTPNAQFSPGCSTSAAVIKENSATAAHFADVQMTAPFTVRPYTYIGYAARVVGTRDIYIQIFDSTFGSQATVGVDLGSCSISIVAAVTGSFTGPTATATQSTPGFCKITLTFTFISSASDGFILATMANGTSLSYAGDNTSSIAIWGVSFL